MGIKNKYLKTDLYQLWDCRGVESMTQRSLLICCPQICPHFFSTLNLPSYTLHSLWYDLAVALLHFVLI